MEHNGIEITVSDKGVFCGGGFTATSLAGLKKKIDGGQVFVPFKARSGVNAGYDRHITEIRKSPSKWQNNHVFAWGRSKYDTSERVWLAVTDETDIAAIADLDQQINLVQEQINQLAKQEDDLQQKVVAIKNKYSLTADEYLAGKRP